MTNSCGAQGATRRQQQARERKEKIEKEMMIEYIIVKLHGNLPAIGTKRVLKEGEEKWELYASLWCFLAV